MTTLQGGTLRAALALMTCLVSVLGCCTTADPLPSRNDGPAKQRIIAFVERVTDPAFVAPAERVAVFDDNRCLRVEKPIYTQLAFAMDRIRALSGSLPDSFF
jgi:hypothetical protein